MISGVLFGSLRDTLQILLKGLNSIFGSPWENRGEDSSDPHALHHYRALLRSGLSSHSLPNKVWSTLQMDVRNNSKPPSRRLVDWILWNISGNVGLVSAGRINKDTPPLTTPGHTSKSSAMDISSHMF